MTTYTTFEQEIKGNIFSLTVASGKHNYINISKLTNNPFRTVGKDYENYDKAVTAYNVLQLGEVRDFYPKSHKRSTNFK